METTEGYFFNAILKDRIVLFLFEIFDFLLNKMHYFFKKILVLLLLYGFYNMAYLDIVPFNISNASWSDTPIGANWNIKRVAAANKKTQTECKMGITKKKKKKEIRRKNERKSKPGT